MSKKTMTRTIQYLCGSVIYLRPQSCKDFIIIREKEIQGVATVFLLTLKTRPRQKTLITKLHFLHKMGPKSFPEGVALEPLGGVAPGPPGGLSISALA